MTTVLCSRGGRLGFECWFAVVLLCDLRQALSLSELQFPPLSSEGCGLEALRVTSGTDLRAKLCLVPCLASGAQPVLRQSLWAADQGPASGKKTSFWLAGLLG